MCKMVFWILAALSLSACDAVPPSDSQKPNTDKPLVQDAPPIPSVGPSGSAISRPPEGTPASAKSNASAHQKRLLPLAQILSIAATRVAGEVIDVELDDDEDDGSVTYELEILTSDGRIFEVTLDAHTGKILDVDDD